MCVRQFACTAVQGRDRHQDSKPSGIAPLRSRSAAICQGADDAATDTERLGLARGNCLTPSRRGWCRARLSPLVDAMCRSTCAVGCGRRRAGRFLPRRCLWSLCCNRARALQMNALCISSLDLFIILRPFLLRLRHLAPQPSTHAKHRHVLRQQIQGTRCLQLTRLTLSKHCLSQQAAQCWHAIRAWVTQLFPHPHASTIILYTLTPRQSADTDVVHTSWVTGHLDAAKHWPNVEHQGSRRPRGRHSHNNSRRCNLQQQTARPAHDTVLASPPNPKPSWDSSGTGTRCSIYHRAARHLQAPGSAAQRWHRHPRTQQHPQIKDALTTGPMHGQEPHVTLLIKNLFPIPAQVLQSPP